MGKSRIEIDQNIHFGKPCIKGTRITVQDILELVKQGISFDNIIHEYYPDITTEDIKACIQYTIDIVSSEDIHISV